MATTSLSPDTASLATNVTSSTPRYTPSTLPSNTASTGFQPPTYASFPPFYTLQPNLTTRARQLELWAQLITTYCAHHKIFRLSLTSPPPDLFANPSIKRSLKQSDVRAVLDHMSSAAGGSQAEWIAPASKTEQSSACYVFWRPAAEWADMLLAWVEETGQKGAVLTVYELREGDATEGKEWKGMDEGMLRKVLGVLVKRGKAQVFATGQGSADGEGVKFF